MKAVNHKRKLISALLLLGIYLMHLGIFNSMMYGSFQIKDNLSWFCFDRNSQTNEAHPCMAADYQRLLKHEDNSKHTFLYKSANVLALVMFLVIPVYQSPRPQAAHLPLKFFHFSDDAFKRYRLLSIFLI